jgi:uncharacterized protein (DUF1778 family)
MNSQQRSKQVLSLRVSDRCRDLLRQVAARLALKRRRRCTMTEVLEEGVLLLAKREKLELDGEAS